MGWHLYLRDYRAFRRNQDGTWGWIRRPWENEPVMSFLSSLNISMSWDGTCEDDGIAEFARRYPIKGRRAGGRYRGCIAVEVDEIGGIAWKNG